MKTAKRKPKKVVRDFIDAMESKDTYYGCPNPLIDSAFMGAALTQRAQDKDSCDYYRDQEKVIGKVQLDFQKGSNKIQYVDALPIVLERSSGRDIKLFLFFILFLSHYKKYVSIVFRIKHILFYVGYKRFIYVSSH